MCGRYSLTSPPEAMVRLFGLETTPNWPARYNIAPTQMAPVVVAGAAGGRAARLMRWGLIPGWAKDPTMGARMINARAETVAEKPSFRAAFRKRRCLVPADGFYEWTGAKGAKQPYRIEQEGREPFAFAGLHELWSPGGEEPVKSYTIITTDAGPALKSIHHRMPVIVPPQAFDAWLDETASPDALHRVLEAATDTELTAFMVSKRVNNVRHDDADCLAPLDDTSAAINNEDDENEEGRLL